jgi:hypothetical protein
MVLLPSFLLRSKPKASNLYQIRVHNVKPNIKKDNHQGFKPFTFQEISLHGEENKVEMFLMNTQH